MAWFIGSYIIIGIVVFAWASQHVMSKVIDSLKKEKSFSRLNKTSKFIVVYWCFPFVSVMIWPFLVLIYLKGFMSVIMKRLRS